MNSTLIDVLVHGGVPDDDATGETRARFLAAALPGILIGGALYGLAMGLGVGPDSTWRTPIKIALILFGTYAIALPPTRLALALFGVRTRPWALAAIGAAGFLTAALILAMASPLVFLYALTQTPGGDLVQLVAVLLAILLGLTTMGIGIRRAADGAEAAERLILPVAVAALFIAMGVYQLQIFFAPYTEETTYFSVGVERLRQNLGLDEPVQ